MISAFELGEDQADLVAREHNGEAAGPVGADDAVNDAGRRLQNLFVEKEKSGEGLVLGGGADMAVNGQVREEPSDLRRSHFIGMALVVEQDEAPGPGNVNPLTLTLSPEYRGEGTTGTDAVVPQPAGMANAVQQSRRLR